jgi:hypothetical protein
MIISYVSAYETNRPAILNHARRTRKLLKYAVLYLNKVWLRTRSVLEAMKHLYVSAPHILDVRFSD